MAEEETEELVFGIWEREDFMDSLVFSLFAALVGFLTAFLYKAVSTYLEGHSWYGEVKK